MSNSVLQEAGFVREAVGSRFRVVSQPGNGLAIGTVIAAHAWAEEMNKSRRICARMALLLAENGWRVVQRDLLGCGDSSGDFVDASWEAWVADIDSELSLADAASPVWLWGVRAGALLASAALLDRPNVNLLLWQPVTSGAQHLQQFLRLHAGARIVGSGKAGGGNASPAQRLRAGQSIEVGGYAMNPALAAGLERATFDVPVDFTGRVVWFDLAKEESPQLSPAAIRAIERLTGRDVQVEAHALIGPAFWQAQEIEECESLLLRSLESVMRPLTAAAESRLGAAEPQVAVAEP